VGRAHWVRLKRATIEFCAGAGAPYEWLAPSVRDIRMLRIDEWNDLNPAVAAAIGIGEQGELDL